MMQVHITTGSLNGIGLEVSVKSLLKLKPQKNIQFILWRSGFSSPFLKDALKQLKKVFRTKQYSIYPSCVSEEIELVDIISDLPPVEWVKSATKLCLDDCKTNAIVTAPLSKLDIQQQGYFFRGHTDLLKNLSKCPDLFMCFLGNQFNVVLLTDHMPLKEVRINLNILTSCIDKTLSFRSQFLQSKKPIGLLGINPHAGENGILGKEEVSIFNPILKKYKEDVKGSLVPDTAFDKTNWKQFSFYLCPYHDQGLIPFKMIHPHQGVHTTLGIPFIRTSPTHGTAENIFGQNKANCQSMKQAISFATRWIQKNGNFF